MSTIYDFFRKLVKHNIIHITFKQTVDKYLLKSNNNIFLTDTSLIANKGGCDKKSYNPQLFILLCKINNYCNEIKNFVFYYICEQLTKHNSTKISSINDIKGMPLDIDLYSSNINDSKILNLHLNKVKFFKNNDNNIMSLKDMDASRPSRRCWL